MLSKMYGKIIALLNFERVRWNGVSYMKPFIFFFEPTGHHIIVCVILSSSSVVVTPTIALQ